MLTVLMSKPNGEAVLIDLEDGNSETISRLVDGPYSTTQIKATRMIIIHSSKKSPENHPPFNRQIDKKLYFGTILIARSEGRKCLCSLEGEDIIKLVEIVPQKQQIITRLLK